MIAHVRGGTDCGYGWYDPDGKMMKKKNTFLDFISAAEFLVKEKYTSEGKIAIQGGSAGCAHALPSLCRGSPLPVSLMMLCPDRPFCFNSIPGAKNSISASA